MKFNVGDRVRFEWIGTGAHDGDYIRGVGTVIEVSRTPWNAGWPYRVKFEPEDIVHPDNSEWASFGRDTLLFRETELKEVE